MNNGEIIQIFDDVQKVIKIYENWCTWPNDKMQTFSNGNLTAMFQWKNVCWVQFFPEREVPKERIYPN
jgi:hypothetical protein